MFLSVILPVYNVEEYIRTCLNSILACFKEDCELILVTGASIDFSNGICLEYKNAHNNITVLNQDGRGLSNARNCGMAIAQGDYIAFLDSDDYIIPDRFMLLLKYIRSGLEADAYVSDYIGVSESGQPLVTTNQIPQTDAPILDSECLEVLLNSSGNFWNVWRYIYRRSFLEQLGFRFRENCYAEDVIYSVEILLHAKRIAFFHNPYYCYRMYRRGSLMMAADPKKVVDTIEVIVDSVNLVAQSTAFQYRKEMQKMLFHEYIIIAATLCEIPRNNRHDVASLYKLKLAQFYNLYGKAAQPFYILIRIVGISLFSNILYNIKRIRRSFRKHKSSYNARQLV